MKIFIDTELGMLQCEGTCHPTELQNATHALLDFTGEVLMEIRDDIRWTDFTILYNNS